MLSNSLGLRPMTNALITMMPAMAGRPVPQYLGTVNGQAYIRGGERARLILPYLIETPPFPAPFSPLLREDFS